MQEWNDQAFGYLVEYSKMNSTPFMIEDVRGFAEARGLNAPTSKRAWGAVAIRAKKANLISKIGYDNVSNPNAHSTPAGVWKVCQ